MGGLEGVETPTTRKVLGKGLVKKLRTVLSHRRSRRFESAHLREPFIWLDPPR